MALQALKICRSCSRPVAWDAARCHACGLEAVSPPMGEAGDDRTREMAGDLDRTLPPAPRRSDSAERLRSVCLAVCCGIGSLALVVAAFWLGRTTAPQAEESVRDVPLMARAPTPHPPAAARAGEERQPEPRILIRPAPDAPMSTGQMPHLWQPAAPSPIPSGRTPPAPAGSAQRGMPTPPVVPDLRAGSPRIVSDRATLLVRNLLGHPVDIVLGGAEDSTLHVGANSRIEFLALPGLVKLRATANGVESEQGVGEFAGGEAWELTVSEDPADAGMTMILERWKPAQP